LIYEYDGVNLDFENIYLADSDLFSEFVRKVNQAFDRIDMPVSIDVTVPGGSNQWSLVYDRVSLGQQVDYLMLMAYDEFWASSDISGPVASIPWVIEGLEATLELVDSDQVVLGIPGYMRVWKDYGNSNESSVLSIINRDKYLKENDYQAVFDDVTGVNYAEKRVNGVLYRIWIEDTISIASRLQIRKDYELPGVAVWRRGFLDYETVLQVDQGLSE
jgi:spore germination protein YaaH